MDQLPVILGIETSCDETAIALLRGDTELITHQLYSQIELHQAFGGVVPEAASRSHLEKIFPLLESVLQESKISKEDIGAIAATSTPGLIGCLLVGTTLAKALAFAWQKPFIAVNHIEGHLHAPFLEFPDFAYPFLSLTVSGGHSAIYRVSDLGQYELLGQTLDDAAGEVLDKIARLMGLGYPGGPVIDRLAKLGNPKAFHFSVSNPKRGPTFMSFSGLKTEARRLFEREILLPSSALRAPSPARGEGFQQVALDFIASFQEAVVNELLSKFARVTALFPGHRLAFSGGVSVNSRLREKAKEKWSGPLYFSSPQFCTDNAAMIAYVGQHYVKRGTTSALTLEAQARSPLSPRTSSRAS